MSLSNPSPAAPGIRQVAAIVAEACPARPTEHKTEIVGENRIAVLVLPTPLASISTERPSFWTRSSAKPDQYRRSSVKWWRGGSMYLVTASVAIADDLSVDRNRNESNRAGAK